MKLVWPSAKLLQAVAGASLRAYHHVTRSVLPLLLEQYSKHSQVRGTLASVVTDSRARCPRWLCGARWEQSGHLPRAVGGDPWAPCGLAVLG